jgi:hypothetical protein
MVAPPLVLLFSAITPPYKFGLFELPEAFRKTLFFMAFSTA